MRIKQARKQAKCEDMEQSKAGNTKTRQATKQARKQALPGKMVRSQAIGLRAPSGGVRSRSGLRSGCQCLSPKCVEPFKLLESFTCLGGHVTPSKV